MNRQGDRYTHTLGSRISYFTRRGFMGLTSTAALACAGATPVPTPSTTSALHTSTALARPGESAQSLKFDWAAANLALQPPYDTIQLRAIPRTASGLMIPDLTVNYITSDSTITVSPTGLVKACKTAGEGNVAHVIASVIQGGHTLTDTASVQVTKAPLPGPLATLSIHPQPGGLKGAYGNLGNSDFNIGLNATIPLFATMAMGDTAKDTLCNARGCRYPLLVHFTSSDPTIAYIDDQNPPGAWHPLRVGHVIFTVSTVAYGVRKVDSLPFSVGYNVRTTADLYVAGLRPPRLGVRPSPAWGTLNTLPYGAGLHYFVSNHSGEQVEVSLPQPTHGVHFDGGDGITELPLPKPVDTLSARSDAGATIVMDSAGTYVIHYRALTSGAVHSDTISVLPVP